MGNRERQAYAKDRLRYLQSFWVTESDHEISIISGRTASGYNKINFLPDAHGNYHFTVDVYTKSGTLDSALSSLQSRPDNNRTATPGEIELFVEVITAQGFTPELTRFVEDAAISQLQSTETAIRHIRMKITKKRKYLSKPQS